MENLCVLFMGTRLKILNLYWLFIAHKSWYLRKLARQYWSLVQYNVAQLAIYFNVIALKLQQFSPSISMPKAKRTQLLGFFQFSFVIAQSCQYLLKKRLLEPVVNCQVPHTYLVSKPNPHVAKLVFPKATVRVTQGNSRSLNLLQNLGLIW